MGRGDARNAEPRQTRDTHRTTPRLWTHHGPLYANRPFALLAVAGPKEASPKTSAGFSAGLCLFRCILVQLGAGGENAKSWHVSALHVHAFGASISPGF
jgi:hypothetical protein